MARTFGVSFTAQAWDGETLLSEIAGLSYDAAREIAAAATLTGHTGRLMSDAEDYCEVYTRDGVRRGTFAHTTLVSAQPEGSR